MKLVKTLIGVLFATALFATAAVASDLKGPAFNSSKLFGWGTTNAENWTLSLAGGGATTTTGDSQSVLGVNIQLGHTDTIIVDGEVGIRQGINWASPYSGNWAFNTAIYQDWNILSYKSLSLYAGGNVGTIYGNRSMEWTLSPEVETRIWLKKDVYMFFRPEYAFDLNGSGLKSQDSLRYFLGVGFSF
jgi:hypothetical protein